MTTFDKREEGFEKKFAHDEELRFKASARRNKLLGLWAAESSGLRAMRRSLRQGGRDVRLRGSRRRRRAQEGAQGSRGERYRDVRARVRRAMNELMDKAIAEVKVSG